MFKDALFLDPGFEAFSASVIAAEATLVAEDDPHLVAIEKAISAISDRLRTLTSVVQTRQVAATTQVSELKGEVKELRDVLVDFVKGSFTATTTHSFSTPLMLAAASPVLPLVVTPLPVAAPTPIVLSKKPVTPVTPLRKLIQQEAQAIPSYKLSRDVYTIPDLWKMWTVGLGGMPPVEALDAQWGSGWRQHSAER
jgi:hypothetical protein